MYVNREILKSFEDKLVSHGWFFSGHRGVSIKPILIRYFDSFTTNYDYAFMLILNTDKQIIATILYLFLDLE